MDTCKYMRGYATAQGLVSMIMTFSNQWNPAMTLSHQLSSLSVHITPTPSSHHRSCVGEPASEFIYIVFNDLSWLPAVATSRIPKIYLLETLLELKTEVLPPYVFASKK